MAHLIKPQDTKVVTKEGECQVSISLELTIKLDGDNLSISSPKEKVEEKEEMNWAIPDFSSGKKLNFGKQE